MKRRFKAIVIEAVEITGIADRGKSVGRHDGQVVFVDGAVPGDIVDILVQKKKAGVLHGVVKRIVKPSPDRVTPFCAHFGICGGCKWQYLSYDAQLEHKQKEVENALTRIGKVDVGEYLPIAGGEENQYYRNKLEFTFSDRRWLTDEQIKSGETFSRDGAGFHLPGHFDKVVDIEHCYLQPEPSNSLRNSLRAFALENELTFYNIKQHTGLLRTMIVRTASTGEVMVTICFGEDKMEDITKVMAFVRDTFPVITSLNYVINTKFNDTIYDLDVINYHGQPFITEVLGHARFQVGPKSFFQTNTRQAEVLYQIALEFAGLKGGERVYDLYTGLGSIACFIAPNCAEVIGIEEVEAAIDDAKVNATYNGFNHLHFYAGDVKELLNHTLIEKHGRPDCIITDPPRAGMHEKVVETLLQLKAPRIVYVSCNPSTQARDLALLSESYRVVRSKAVDMFPHTHHIENVVQLDLI